MRTGEAVPKCSRHEGGITPQKEQPFTVHASQASRVTPSVQGTGTHSTCRPDGRAGPLTRPPTPTAPFHLGFWRPERGWCRSEGSSWRSMKGPGDGAQAPGSSSSVPGCPWPPSESGGRCWVQSGGITAQCLVCRGKK